MTEIEIERLRLAAFKTNSNEDKAAYYLAVSKWFQDRHYRADAAQNMLSALRDAEETLRLVERPAFRDQLYGDEVEALGLRIGFGALMSSASASWRERLAADGDPVGGEFVCGPCRGSVIAVLAKIRAAIAKADQP